MTRRTVLITGGGGMLARDVTANLSARPDFEVFSLPRGCLDVTRAEEIEAALSDYRPQVVINTAGIHVDHSENLPELAFQVNAWAARNLAEACERHSATLVQISTGGLFGDSVRAYHEYDSVVLKTTYARSKHAGEECVRYYCRRHFILRLGWLYGGTVEHPKNFVVARYREALEKPVIQSAADKHGSPTYTGDVACAISRLLASEKYGLYHVANQGGCTRAEYVRYILAQLGLDTVVQEVDSTHFPRSAVVPDCEILTSLNLGYAGLPLLPPWEEALARYIRTIRDQVN